MLPGGGLFTGRPEGRVIVPYNCADIGENISKARRRCISFFIEWSSFLCCKRYETGVNLV